MRSSGIDRTYQWMEGVSGMNMQTLARHYDEKYRKSAVEQRLIRGSAWPRDRCEAAYGLLAQRSGRYLEIGAGEGRLAAALEGVFGEMWLVELAGSRVAQLRNRFAGRDRAKVIEGDMESEAVVLPDDFFDATAMVAVIEHLLDPIRALRKLHRSLRPGGILVVETPNIAKYSRRIKLLSGYFPATAARREGFATYDNASVDLMDEGHLHYFTYRSLRRLCVEYVGFRFVEVMWYGSWATTRCPGILARLLPSLFSECLIVATK